MHFTFAEDLFLLRRLLFSRVGLLACHSLALRNTRLSIRHAVSWSIETGHVSPWERLGLNLVYVSLSLVRWLGERERWNAKSFFLLPSPRHFFADGNKKRLSCLQKSVFVWICARIPSHVIIHTVLNAFWQVSVWVRRSMECCMQSFPFSSWSNSGLNRGQKCA